MKYSELISFNPIEDVIQLTTANDKEKAKSYVSSYVMSDNMADNLKATVIDQLQMDEVIDNKGVLIVGNYGTGKSHLMSVISSLATDAENLAYVGNKKFANYMENVAGKFEVLRIEIGGVTMPLRQLLIEYIEEDFERRGIDYTAPDLDSVRNNKDLITGFMTAFATKYPDKGYLIVVDEFLAYLTSRNQQQIVLDLEFFRALGEMCSKSKLRLICGVQEKIFDNPKFTFVADTLKHVSDRFAQMIITKEATAYVVSERILKKNSEQKSYIRAHLEKFTNLYGGMSSRLEEFVDLFPIHPAYIDVFNKIYLIENRHILKNISVTIKNIFNEEVAEDRPGIISFDDYWPAIKNNGLLKSDVTISRVVNASSQLEDIINRSFTRPQYKPLALQIIYALSVHRLTTQGLDVRDGLTSENLKDNLCLYMQMPEPDADFLQGMVNTTLREIMKTVSGQFIIHNDANDQYYIDVDKIVDYDEKIKQQASMLADNQLNRYFYNLIYFCLEWDATQYVTNFEIYEYDLNWESHNIFREGYLFMGLPGERSTAQPERDFYIHIMPPYDVHGTSVQNLQDEVYLYFKSKSDFKDMLGLYSAACYLADRSEGKDKEAYQQKALQQRKQLVKYLNENKNTCFEVSYKGQKKQLIEVLGSKYRPELAFKDVVDIAASLTFDEYFQEKYPKFPVLKTKITKKNMVENARAAFDCFAGRKNLQAKLLLDSFGVLDQDKIRPEGSMYAKYYIDLLNKLPKQGVINYSDIFYEDYRGEYYDKAFNIYFVFTPIIFLSLVYSGHAVLTLTDGKKLTAANLDEVPRIPVVDLYEFKYISKPSDLAMAELKKLFEVLEINPALLDNPNTRDKGVEYLLERAQHLTNAAAMVENKLNPMADFNLWSDPLAPISLIEKMKKACTAIKSEFSNYSVKFNTPAKLNNFRLTMEEIDALAAHIVTLKLIQELLSFKNKCVTEVTYVANIRQEYVSDELKGMLLKAKEQFTEIRDEILEGMSGEMAAQRVSNILGDVKAKYIDFYYGEHQRKRLDAGGAKRRNEITESKALSRLKKLRNIEMVSSQKLVQIEQNLSDLKVCYDLTAEELKGSVVCPYCHYVLGDKERNVVGVLDNIEARIDTLSEEWTNTLLDTLSDPIVGEQKKFLSAEQQKVIDDFVASKVLPDRVDDFFVNAITTLLKGFEPVVINTHDFIGKLEALPPMDEAAFSNKIKSILAGYTKGKDASKIRIVVKS